MNITIGRIITGLILLLVSISAFAEAPNISSSAVDNHTDLSIAYLAQVFGTVGNSLHGTAGQMLGQLFYKFNIGILVVTGMWSGYTVITIALKSAMDGSFMGQNKNVAITLLKLAIGVVLVIPNPTTGYCLFQEIVMKVVVKGVALADETWSYGLDYIDNGGTVWHRPEEGMLNGSGDVKRNSSLMKVMGKIYRSEICMIASSMSSQKPPKDSGSAIYNNPQIIVQYHVVDDQRNGAFQFPGVGNNPDLKGQQGNCGSISYMTFRHVSSDYFRPNPDAVSINGCPSATCQYAKNSLRIMIDALMPAAKKFVCSSNDFQGNPDCIGVATTNKDSYNKESFFGALVDYLNAIMPVAQKASGDVSRDAKNFLGAAKSEGWMMAGRYYWDLSRIQDRYEGIGDLSDYVPENGKDPKEASPSALDKDGSGDIKKLMTGIGEVTDKDSREPPQSILDSYINGAIDKYHAYSAASHRGDSGRHYNTDVGAVASWILAIIPFVGDLYQMIQLFDTSSRTVIGMGPDPIMFLHNLGMRCISLAGQFWFVVAGCLIILFLPTIFMNSYANFSTPIKEAVDWVKGPLIIVGGMFLSVGIMLGYYVPLYPYMLFIFGVIGWIISVIEAIAAAPLVCLGLTHPEGHDFLGQAQQAMMLLLGVFIRPVLMVIGLIAGMILSYVSLRILVYTFSGFMSDIFYMKSPYIYDSNGAAASGDILREAGHAMGNIMGAQGGAGFFMALLAFPLFLIIFASIVYTVTNQCFSLIHVLPDYVIRWIGGSPGQSTASQMAQEVKGAISGAGSQIGRFGGAMARAVHGRKEQTTGTGHKPTGTDKPNEKPKTGFQSKGAGDTDSTDGVELGSVGKGKS